MRLTLTGVPFRLATLLVLGGFLFAGVLRAGEPNPPEGFRALFDGKSLDGWHGNNPHQTEKAPAEEREQAIAAHRAVGGDLHSRQDDPRAAEDDH